MPAVSRSVPGFLSETKPRPGLGSGRNSTVVGIFHRKVCLKQSAYESCHILRGELPRMTSIRRKIGTIALTLKYSGKLIAK